MPACTLKRHKDEMTLIFRGTVEPSAAATGSPLRWVAESPKTPRSPPLPGGLLGDSEGVVMEEGGDGARL